MEKNTMKKTIKLSESDLMRIVKRVVNEQSSQGGGGGKPTVNYATKPDCKPGDNGTLVRQKNIFALSSVTKGGVFCKINTSSSYTTQTTTRPAPSIGKSQRGPSTSPTVGKSQQGSGTATPSQGASGGSQL